MAKIKGRAPTDATMRNVRAGHSRVVYVQLQQNALKLELTQLVKRVRALEKLVARLAKA